MFYLIPTKRGLGVELWGSYDDLDSLYAVIGKFWSQEGFSEKKGFNSRDQIISGFVHEIRKAYEGSRLTRQNSHFSFEEVKYFGCEVSWVHLLFSLSAIRHNMRFFESDKLDLAIMLQLEYWVESSLRNFDEVGAIPLLPYVSNGIYQGNDHTYLFMRSINATYFALGGGKAAFRKLPQLMRRAVYGSDEYKNYSTFLSLEAQRLNCEIKDLELSDDDIDYERIKW
ncbi:hypothetical protein PV783_24590 [Chitinophaga sp. CC14]|uniref:DUF6904 family protein n=1 Tax=Chitinophaga sp. CC14 TaxID=3029199 RepID=UPI003B7D5B7A